jgi:hypothetical protein
MATVANIFIDQGADYSNIITVGSSSGAPLNLTGYTVASQIRKSYSSSIAYNFTASIFSASEGRVRVQLTASASGAIPPGRYLYDVEITSSSGTKTRVVEGIVTVNPEITQI